MIAKHPQPAHSSWIQHQRRQRRRLRARWIGTITTLVAVLSGAFLLLASCSADRVSSVSQSQAAVSSTSPQSPSPSLSPSTSPSPSQTLPLGLAIVGLDGSVRRDLGLPTDAWEPDLSADGSKVTFLTTSVQVGICGGCARRTDRLAVVQVGKASGAFVYPHHGSFRSVAEPAWSPDGRQIAFVAMHQNNRDIYVAELGKPGVLIEARVRRLTVDPAVDEFPAWSPDGTTIFYDSSGEQPVDNSGFSPTQEIWSVPANGGTPRRVTRNSKPDAQLDASSGGVVAFWREGEIWTMDQDGQHQVRLASVPGGAVFNPRWSPDGTMMALLKYDPSERAMPLKPVRLRDDDAPLMQVVVVNLATGHVKTVGPRVASDVNPVTWTPDGSALLINRYDAGA